MSNVRFETRSGVVLAFGEISTSAMMDMMAKVPKDAVIATGIASALGATMAAGSKADVDRLAGEIERELKAAPPRIEGLSQAAAAWVCGTKTGLSSRAMLARFSGVATDRPTAYPHDADDFGRCLGFLDAVPEYRGRLKKMADVSETWAAIVEIWDELEALYRSGTPADYEAIYTRLQGAANTSRAGRATASM